MKFEFRFWSEDEARRRYELLVAKGKRCNMSKDGRGVIVFDVLPVKSLS